MPSTTPRRRAPAARTSFTYHWHAVSFDGPALPVDRSYQVPDSLIAQCHGNNNVCGVNLGYSPGLQRSATELHVAEREPRWSHQGVPDVQRLVHLLQPEGAPGDRQRQRPPSARPNPDAACDIRRPMALQRRTDPTLRTAQRDQHGQRQHAPRRPLRRHLPVVANIDLELVRS